MVGSVTFHARAQNVTSGAMRLEGAHVARSLAYAARDMTQVVPEGKDAQRYDQEGI